MKLLLLAGTGEARALASRLAADGRFEVTASLAGETRTPEALDVPVRVGGFGGEADQEKYISDNGFGAVIDATHPFADQISRRTQAICARLALPYLQLLRPGWQPGPADHWRFVEDEAAVAEAVPEGATVFLATGRKSLARIGALPGRVFSRVVDEPTAPFPYPGGEWVVGRPPFPVDEEQRLFKVLGIDLLVVKDAGGLGGRAKLDAARALGLPVIVIARPPQPPGEKAETVEAALAWAERLL